LSYLITGRTGFAGPKKQSEKFNAQGKAQIQIIDEAAFFALAAPRREEAIALLTGGPDAIDAFEKLAAACGRNLPDLSGADLRAMRCADDNARTDLTWLPLKGADFRGAHLVGVRFGALPQVNIDGACFRNCHLGNGYNFERSTLRNADAAEAYFGHCNVASADFSGSDLTRGGFSSVSGDGARFVKTNLADAVLTHARLKQPDFTRATLARADLTASELSQANFARADLRGAMLAGARLLQADFSGADLRDADLTGADLHGATFKGAKLAGACLQLAQLDAAALDEAVDVSSKTVELDGRVGPKLHELQQVALTAVGVTMDVTFRRDNRPTKIRIDVHPKSTQANWSEPYADGRRFSQRFRRQPQLIPVILSVAFCFRDAAFEFDELSVKSTKSKVSGKVLRQLALEAWCEACGVPVPDAQAVKSQKQSRGAKLGETREKLLTLLRGGAAGVKVWNALSDRERGEAGHFREVDLSRARLAGATLWDLDFRKSNLAAANLSKATLNGADLREAVLSGARLDNAYAARVKFQNAKLDSASLKGAQVSHSVFEKADLQSANLTKAKLEHTNLCGANLTDAVLDGANLEGSTYDDATKWPAGFNDFTSLKWAGQGPNPALEQAKQARAAGGPIDLPLFLKRLEEEVDPARLDKALSMLKADRFRLFAEVQPDSVVGVVKSQTDPDLVYSCRLAADGTFACCTQNLNICGGLRGALCKHLLVLLIGLTKAEQLDPTTVDQWIAASRLQKPVLQKELMSETFLRYKGAEAGEIDWRPTETIPEDYYAV
jgi:uncharacterized protein YjbI with pentapeptide repeats